MKKFVKKLLRTIDRNKETVVIGIVSIIAFIVGCLAIGWWKALIIIGVADLLLLIPVMKKKKKPNSKTSKKASTTKKKKIKKICKIIVIVIFVLFIIGVIAFSLFFSYIAKNTKKFNPENLYQKEASILYDINGNIIRKLGSEQREKISYNDLPEVLVNAIIATEDSRFFQHSGFDLPRFFVASVKQVLTGGGGGASTLTMQLSKNFYTSTEADGFEGIKRKFTDIYTAMFQIEKNYSKQQIIEFYVNAPYLGGGAYGVEQASINYFGKSAKDLNLAEAAMIAGLFQAPNSYDPTLHPEAAEKRRKTVLYLMERHGYITTAERKAADAMNVTTLLAEDTNETPTYQYQSFVDTVVEEVIKRTKQDPYVTPMEIYTTMDPEKQTYIDNIMNGVTYEWPNDQITSAVAVINVKDGSITAIGGGRNKKTARTLNLATSMKKQIGSTSKPIFDYGPGIEYQNWGTNDIYVDEPFSYSNGGNLNNWDRKFYGLMTLRDALAQSRNIPALKAFKKNTQANIKTFTTSLGLTPDFEGNMIHEAHSIGGYSGESPLTMAVAFAAFSNGGYYIEPYSVTKIIYRDSGETVETKIEKKRVMSEETAYIMCDLLKSAASYGLGSRANVNGAVFGAKTGTSNYTDQTINAWGLRKDAVNDLWVDGISPDYSISMWYGIKELSKENAPYVNFSSTVAHTKLFQAIAKGFFKAGSDWTRPSGVVEVTVEKETNPVKLASEFTPENMKSTALYKKGTEPTEVSDRYNKLNNISNLTSSVKDNVLTLKWNAIATPPGINETVINQFLDSVYTNAEYKATAKGQRDAYNNAYIGTVVYNVYSKDKEGNLTLIKTVDTNSVDIPVTSTSATTYVVKTSYSIFKSNMSDGVEAKISLDNIKTVVTSELKGNKTMNLTIGDKFIDPGIIILEDTVDVTSKATVKKVIKNKLGKEVTTIDTTIADTYTITYQITYQKFTDTLTRTVVVKEKTVPEVPTT